MLVFRTLGACTLEDPDGGTPIAPVVLQPKRLALLAYLALARPRGFHRRDTLLALFWPDSDTKRARNALNQGLHSLRSGLGDAGIQSLGNEAIALTTGALRCDAIDFEEHLDAGRFADAIELYRGDLLAGLHAPEALGFERWLDAERRRFRRRAKDAVVRLADAEETAGNAVAAVRRLERGLEISPIDETLVRRLVRLLDGAGDRAGAIRTYERFAEQLRNEYESDPAPETEALIQAVRERRPLASVANTRVDRVPSLAVLPLDSLSARPDEAYIAEGMTEMLITELAGLKNLRVLSRQSSSAFRDLRRPLPETARRLDVDLVVEGSVLQAGNRMRITAQLLRPEPEEHIWADTFDGPTEDVLELQRSVARAIAREVARRFDRPIVAPASDAGPVDPRAYDEFLRGVVRFPYTTPTTFAEVMGYFERAAAIDETFADAHAFIAFAWLNAVYVGACSLEEARERAAPRIVRALSLAPDTGSSHAIHATALFCLERDWAASLEAWERAEQLGGGDPRSYASFALLLTGLGRFDEAMARAREMVRTNPLGPPEQFLVGYIHFRARRFAAAVEQLEWVETHWPGYPWTGGILAASLLFAGWPAKALESCRRALEHPNIPTSLAFVAATLGRAGEQQEARAIIEQLEHIDRTAYLDPCPLAVAWAGIGERDLALSALERLLEDGSVQSWSLPVEVFFEPLRSEPRFRRVMDALGLPVIPGSA